MDIIILAAGRNERLNGIVPPYHKPVLVINGKPLISQLVESVAPLLKLYTTKDSAPRIIIVCAPQNAEAICSVLPKIPEILIVIQRECDGVLNALRIGLSVTTENVVTMVCADNVIDRQTWYLPPFNPTDDDAYSSTLFVHGQYMSDFEANKFTYISENIWYEKTPTTANMIFCWLGPIVFSKYTMEDAITSFMRDNPNDTNSIGRVFNYYDSMTRIIESRNIDIGLPENLK